MATLDIKAILAIKDWLWPVLDFLWYCDARTVACLNWDSRKCCEGYVLRWDYFVPRQCIGQFAACRIFACEQLADVKRWWPTLTSINFGGRFDEPLAPGALPEGLRELYLSWGFNQPLVPGALPRSLKVLKLSWQFNCRLEANVLPEKLESLTIAGHFDHQLDANTLPEGLLELEIGPFFDQPLGVGALPGKLKSLRLGQCFNQPLTLENLPASLRKLTVSVRYLREITPPPHCEVIRD